jgi:IPT/TIG domain-containing protein
LNAPFQWAFCAQGDVRTRTFAGIFRLLQGYAVGTMPWIAEIDPPRLSKVAHGDTTLTITGKQFPPNAIVRIGTTDLATEVRSATELVATLPAALWPAEGEAEIIVIDPGPPRTASAVFRMPVR